MCELRESVLRSERAIRFTEGVVPVRSVLGAPLGAGHGILI